MYLKIQIKKEVNKPSTLLCTRRDGSITYSKIQIDFEIHDIAHYAVEMQLQLKNAFYGLLSRGYQICDFLLPKDERPKELQPQNLPSEALATEHLVNLLTIDFMQTDGEMDISKMLEDILDDNGLSFPEKVKKEKITSIQKELVDLMVQWNKLQSGQSLEMVFEFE